MIQEIIVGILFVVAVVYIINIFRKQAKSKSACGSANCKCEGKSNFKRESVVSKD